MEVLKKGSISVFAVLFSILSFAQQEAKLLAAFTESYTQESNKQYTAAIAVLKTVYEEKNYELNLRLGWLSYLNKEYSVSMDFYQKAVALRPYAIEAKFGWVQPLSALLLTDKTLQVYEDILKIDPQNTQANYWTGVIWYNRKKYEPAARYFEKMVNLYPFDYDGNHMLAWTCLNLGRANDAKILFNKALLSRPGDASCLEGLSKIR
ncbi:MAG: tetratricopeptide repeat protein [Sphingobacteriales bacterium]|nr:tetratricopeptide repeat protein [Sphingobacteriales bacterium]